MMSLLVPPDLAVGMPPLCRSCPALWLGPSPLPHTDLLLVNECCCPIRKKQQVCNAHASNLQLPSVFRSPNFQGTIASISKGKHRCCLEFACPRHHVVKDSPALEFIGAGLQRVKHTRGSPVLDGSDHHCWPKSGARPSLPLTGTTPKLSNQDIKP